MSALTIEDSLALIISLISILCSFYIIANRKSYFMGGTQFGILILTVAISDLLSGLFWPITLPFLIITTNVDNGSVQMPIDQYQTLKITLIVLQSVGYFLLFFSLYMALAISIILFYVVVCNGSSKLVSITKVILASSIVPLIDSVLLFLYVPLSQLGVSHQDRQSYAIPQTLVSTVPLLGMTFCFVYTMLKVRKMVEFDFESNLILTLDEKDGTIKVILLKTILALTISNIAYWYLQILLFIFNNHNNTLLSQVAGFLQSVLGPTKGAMHLVALVVSFDRLYEEEIPMNKPGFLGFVRTARLNITSNSFSGSINTGETNSP